MVDPDTAALFFALLTVLANVAVVGTTVLAVAGRLWAPARRAWDTYREVVGPSALWLAWIVAAVSTMGSLWFSEVAGFPPCRLCWYQRIGMYPLAVVLLVAALRSDVGVRRYALPLAALTAPVSAWHVLVERYPSLEGDACDPTNPCSLVWVRELGYATLPTMALSAFTLIIVLLLVARGSSAPASSTREEH